MTTTKEILHSRTLILAAIQNAAPHVDLTFTPNGEPPRFAGPKTITLRMGRDQAERFQIGRGYKIEVSEHGP